MGQELQVEGHCYEVSDDLLPSLCVVNAATTAVQCDTAIGCSGTPSYLATGEYAQCTCNGNPTAKCTCDLIEVEGGSVGSAAKCALCGGVWDAGESGADRCNCASGTAAVPQTGGGTDCTCEAYQAFAAFTEETGEMQEACGECSGTWGGCVDGRRRLRRLHAAEAGHGAEEQQ